jgi:hypothetical protein
MFTRDAAPLPLNYRALLVPVLGLICIFLFSETALAQCSSDRDEATRIQSAFELHNWLEVVQMASPLARTADLNFDYGLALAHLERWQDARAALMAGWRQCPQQKRFAVELAGVAFQQKRYQEAAAWLKRALQLDPEDEYANNFAGTNYFLMGNLDAALKYWNRVQRPKIAALHFDPHLRVQRLLLERAFAFSPAAVLKQLDFEATEVRLTGLGIFPAYNIALSARPDGSFDANFNAVERDGFGSNRVQALVSTFAGAVYETIYPGYFNLGGSATNIESLLRWDAQKRRAWLSVSAPLRYLPRWRWQLSFDGRDENWAIRTSFAGPARVLGSLKLRRETFTGSLASFQSGRMEWSTGGELSHRDYRNITYGQALTPELVAPGLELKHLASFKERLLDVPERHFTLTTEARSEFARLWSSPPRLFAKVQGSAEARWIPQGKGGSYEVEQRVRGGGTLGRAPFDELFMLGVERDNDLWYRGQVGTRDGRKGNSPLGDKYFLSNTGFYKRLYRNGLFGIKAGPLLDIGRCASPTGGLSTQKWLFAAGIEAKLTVFGTSVILTYGRDLRSGNNAFFGTVAR